MHCRQGQDAKIKIPANLLRTWSLHYIDQTRYLPPVPAPFSYRVHPLNQTQPACCGPAAHSSLGRVQVTRSLARLAPCLSPALELCCPAGCCDGLNCFHTICLKWRGSDRRKASCFSCSILPAPTCHHVSPSLYHLTFSDDFHFRFHDPKLGSCRPQTFQCFQSCGHPTTECRRRISRSKSPCQSYFSRSSRAWRVCHGCPCHRQRYERERPRHPS